MDIWSSDAATLIHALETGRDGVAQICALAARPTILKTVIHPGTLDHVYLMGFDDRQPLILRHTLKAIWRSRAEAYLQLARLAN